MNKKSPKGILLYTLKKIKRLNECKLYSHSLDHVNARRAGFEKQSSSYFAPP